MTQNETKLRNSSPVAALILVSSGLSQTPVYTAGWPRILS